jgi:hypothetical protein
MSDPQWEADTTKLELLLSQQRGLLELMIIHQRNLEKLLPQEAMSGIYVPLPLMNEIELQRSRLDQLQSNLQSIEEQIKALQIQVKCTSAYAGISGSLHKFIQITAVNVSQRIVEIVAAGVRLSDGQSVHQVKSKAGYLPLPKRLAPGESVSIMLDFPVLRQALIAVQVQGPVTYTAAFVRDSLDKEYRTDFPKSATGEMTRPD